MARSLLILASLAKDAVAGLDFVQVKELGGQDEGKFDSVLLTSVAGNHYVLRSPANADAVTELDAELKVIRLLSNSREKLPFTFTDMMGVAEEPKGRRSYLFNFVYGNPIEVGAIDASGNLVASIARGVAAIHNLPRNLVETSGLPQYAPVDIVRARITELDRAAQTGRVPGVVLSRWERALEDVNLFRFQTTVIHGNLNGDNLLEQDQAVSGVLNLGSLRIGDPAEDLAWLMSGEDEDLAYNLLLAYQRERVSADANLRQRANLYSELMLARLLLQGLALGDEVDVENAVSYLLLLAANVESGIAPSLAPTGMAPQVDLAEPTAAESVLLEEPKAQDDLF
jgi:hypothetical protein